MFRIDSISLPVPGMDELRAEAQAEGHHFIERLVEEWAGGTNRFDGRGEVLCGHFNDLDLLVAVGGLNRDPFAGDCRIGRIRRVYVRPGWRNRGLGAALVRHLVERARPHFQSVRLRAGTQAAARLYERLGFVAIPDPHATHVLPFDRTGSRIIS